MPGDDAPRSARFDMTVTPADFARQIGQAFPGLRQDAAGRYAGDDCGTSWAIELQPAAPTRIGPIVLERWTVGVDLDSPDARARGRWWARFWGYVQRGGG